MLLNQQVLDLGLVGVRYGTRVAEITLLFLSLFGQDMTVISVLTLDLTCAGESKTLLCSGISFHFWHFRKKLNQLNNSPAKIINYSQTTKRSDYFLHNHSAIRLHDAYRTSRSERHRSPSAGDAETVGVFIKAACGLLRTPRLTCTHRRGPDSSPPRQSAPPYFCSGFFSTSALTFILSKASTRASSEFFEAS